MNDDEKAEFVAAAMRAAKSVSATGGTAQRKRAYRLAIWDAIEKSILENIKIGDSDNVGN